MSTLETAAHGPRVRRGGFALIELLVVLLVIGILIKLAIPHFASTQNGAKLSTVKTDVRSAEIAEEAYFTDYKQYGTLAQLRNAKMFALSGSNTMAIATAATGYTITGTNSSITTSIKKCTVHVGAGAALSVDGKITCP